MVSVPEIYRQSLSQKDGWWMEDLTGSYNIVGDLEKKNNNKRCLYAGKN